MSAAEGEFSRRIGAASGQLPSVTQVPGGWEASARTIFARGGTLAEALRVLADACEAEAYFATKAL